MLARTPAYEVQSVVRLMVGTTYGYPRQNRRFEFDVGAVLGEGVRQPNHPSGESPFWANCWKFDINLFGLYYHNEDGSGYYDLYRDAIIKITADPTANPREVYEVVYAPPKERSIFKADPNPHNARQVIVSECDRPTYLKANTEVFVLDMDTGGKTVINSAAIGVESITMVAPLKSLEV